MCEVVTDRIRAVLAVPELLMFPPEVNTIMLCRQAGDSAPCLLVRMSNCPHLTLLIEPFNEILSKYSKHPRTWSSFKNGLGQEGCEVQQHPLPAVQGQV